MLSVLNHRNFSNYYLCNSNCIENLKKLSSCLNILQVLVPSPTTTQNYENYF